MRMLNYLAAIGIIAAAAAILYWYFSRPAKDEIKDESALIQIEKPTVSELVETTAKVLNSFLRQDFTLQNLTRQELENKNAAKARLRQARKDAAYGNREAKEVILEYIRSIITTNGIVRVTEGNIDEFIPFNMPEAMSAQDKFLLILQEYQKIYGRDGLNRMFSDFEFDKRTEVTDGMAEEAYQLLSDPYMCRKLGLPENLFALKFEDKLDFLTRRVFESYTGFGVADMLLEMDLDEVDAGVSGIPSGSFELNNRFVRSAKYSYESIWILLHGRNIHLSCLSFGSQEELERVCHNIYKYHATRVFSRDQGYVVSSMSDGSRVVVTRPPFSDKYAFYVRKFDSAPSIAPEDLITGPGCEIPLLLCKWFVKGERNIAITGAQGTGKTTMLKSFITWIDNLNIRTQELAFELNLSFSYPDKNISAFQETESVSAQAGLDLQKKTNGAVNIVGEVANAEQASHVIQTANVASLFAMFTHHAKKTSSLVEMFALNLLQLGLYKEKRDAIEIASRTLNVDIHLETTNKLRHIAKICEIIPVEDQEYPSETIQREYEKKNRKPLPYNESLAALDTREFYKRQTDRHLFDVNEICRWEKDHFELVHMPSGGMIAEIRSRLKDEKAEQAFSDDLKTIQETGLKIRERFCVSDSQAQFAEG